MLWLGRDGGLILRRAWRNLNPPIHGPKPAPRLSRETIGPLFLTRMTIINDDICLLRLVPRVVSREEMERFAREAEVAKAQYQSKVEQHSLVDDRAREEDRSLAEADLQLAQAPCPTAVKWHR